MSGIVRPRGRAPVGIYWRRRLVLLAVVLLATAGAVKLVGGGDEPDASASSASTPSDEPPANDGTTGDGPDDEKSGDRKHEPRPSRDDPEVRSGEDDVRLRMAGAQRCDPGRVSVTPSVLPDTYAGGEVALRLGFSTSDSPCVLDLAEERPLISVSAGGETVWTSRRCSGLFETSEVRVEPDWTTYVDARWSGRASGDTCGENADFAEPGEYTVQTALLGGEPASAAITLAKEPEPEKDKDSDKDGEDGKGDEQNADDDTGRHESDSGDGAEQDDSTGDAEPDGGDQSGVDERDGDLRDR